MFDAVVSFLKSLFAEPKQEKLLIPVRVDEKRDQLRRHR